MLKDRAKVLLRMPANLAMSGYTPTCAEFFKAAKAWRTVPEPGDIVYFYGVPEGEKRGRVCHVGIVEWINTVLQTFGTIEGNTSSEYITNNGGCVARHEYSYKAVGGENRVHGFGIPDFKGAGVNISAFVSTATRFIGYEEKKSPEYLDDFHTNAGPGNHTKFQRDTVGWTGAQWCQYFVDAIAVYCTDYDCELLVKVLARGSQGQAVKTVQALLIHKFGISCGKAGIDGDFGQATEKAVKVLQQSYKVAVDGVVGSDTWNILVKS